MTAASRLAPSAIEGLTAALAPVPCLTDPASVKLKSRDFYWYSPLLKRQLREVTGDIVAIARDEAEGINRSSNCTGLRIKSTHEYLRGGGLHHY